MSDYRISDYTYFCRDNGQMLFINTLNKNLMYSDETSRIQHILDNLSTGGLSETDQGILNSLLKNGFIIVHDYDEKTIAQKRYWDEVYDSRLGITVMPTEQCNCRCPYCYESFSKPHMDDKTVEALLSFLGKNLIRYTGLNISWFGGEPLLALEVVEKISKKVLEMCRVRHIMYDSSITTNGVLLTPEVFRKLLNCRISRFQITLDGPKATHDQTRVLRNGKGTFDTIINNLIAIKNSQASAIRVNVRINVTKQTLNMLPEFIEFLSDTFGDDKRFSFYFRPIGDWDHNIEEGTLKDSLLPSLEAVYKILLENPRKLNYGILYQLLLSSMCYANKRNHFVLGSDGTVYKCTVYFNENINKVGKLTPNGVIDWDEEKLAKWVNNDFSASKCKTCFLAATCHGKGCPAKELIYGQKAGCGHEFENVSNILKLLYQSNNFHHYYKKLEV
jgi:putative arylsulfatase regulator